ncbi:MAG: hypothetical protein QOF51_587 [Chloroflexota bacterium]|jgi:uncharacterized membrane protein|nr:hypothetical protein [Chloroflexota bacterium]
MPEESLWRARVRFNLWFVRIVDRVQIFAGRHWLALVNVALVLVAALPILAPVLLAFGLDWLAWPIYTVYHMVCHQWPFRTFFLFGPQPFYSVSDIALLAGTDQVYTFVGNADVGYKMAFCERDLAITLAAIGMGLLYIVVRRRLAPPSLLFYALLLLPIALDGFTQLPGWRESTAELRLATGALAGAATVWLLFPYLELRADRMLASAANWTEGTA